MRVLFFGRGHTDIFFGFCKHLQALGVEIFLAHPPGTADQQHLTASGVQCFPVHFPSRFNVLGYRLFRQLIETVQPDIVHTFDRRTLLPILWATRHHRDLPLVVDRGAVRHPSRFQPLHRLIYFNERVACFATWSDAVRNALIEAGVPPERTCTLYFGHDPVWYEQDPGDLRQELGLSSDTFLAGFIGNIRPVKGFDVLVDAVTLMPKNTRLKVVVFGQDRKGQGRAAVRRSGMSDRFVFLGPRPQAFRWMRSLNCVVVPSRSEGLSKVTVEAMSLRVPVIAARVGALPEIIDHKIDGLLMPPESPQQLADWLTFLETNPTTAQELGTRGRQKIVSRFSVAGTTRKFLELYQRLSDRRAGPVDGSKNS